MVVAKSNLTQIRIGILMMRGQTTLDMMMRRHGFEHNVEKPRENVTDVVIGI